MGTVNRQARAALLIGSVLLAAAGLGACSEGGWKDPAPDAAVVSPSSDDPGGVPADMGAPEPDLRTDAAPPQDMNPTSLPIPDAMLGATLPVSLSCMYEHRGWTRDIAGKCQPTSSSGPSMRIKSLRIDASGGGVYRITAGRDEMLMPGYDYQVDVSAAMPTASWTDSINPVYGKLRKHSYTLGARSLSVAVDTLHDNSSPFPIPQCWEYYYEHWSCSGQITW